MATRVASMKRAAERGVAKPRCPDQNDCPTGSAVMSTCRYLLEFWLRSARPGLTVRVTLALGLFALLEPEATFAGQACAYLTARGTVSAIDLPAGRFRHRIAVADGKNFYLTALAVAGQDDLAFAGIRVLERIELATSTANAGSPTGRNELTGRVVDLQRGKVKGNLPVNFDVWSYSPARNLLATADGGATIVVHDLVAGQVVRSAEVAGDVLALRFSDDGATLYAAHWAWGMFRGLIPSAVSAIDIGTGRIRGVVQLSDDRHPWSFVKPFGLERGYFGPPAFHGSPWEKSLLVVDLDGLRVLGRVAVPGTLAIPTPMTASGDGTSFYLAYGGPRGCEVALLALPEERFIETTRCKAGTVWLVASPDNEWLAAFGFDLNRQGVAHVTVWDASLTSQLGSGEFALGGDPVLTPGPCPDVDPCVADCNADGVVSVDEVVEGVTIALGATGLVDCLPADRSGDGQVTVDELVEAVSDLLVGCE